MVHIFVENLDFTATEAQLHRLFANYGTVGSVSIVKDRDTGQTRGFAFIEMTKDTEAIASLNGVRLNQRALTVNEARPKLLPDPTRATGSRDHRRHQI